MQALDSAASGMIAQKRNVSVISNNIANLETAGYKKRAAEFQDMLYQARERPGALENAQGDVTPAGVQYGTGVEVAGTSPKMTQGNLQKSGGETDLAIKGGGYFGVELENGRRAYTRAGNFEIGPEGNLVTQNGRRVVTDVNVPREITKVEISEDGVVTGFRADRSEGEVLGQIQLFDFRNPAGLRQRGQNLLEQTPASGDAQQLLPGELGVGTIKQGYVEISNVKAVQEITDLIRAQRAYGMNSKVLKASDRMMAQASQVR